MVAIFLVRGCCQASGLAGSGRSPGLLWTVTDKGGPAKVHKCLKIVISYYLFYANTFVDREV